MLKPKQYATLSNVVKYKSNQLHNVDHVVQLTFQNMFSEPRARVSRPQTSSSLPPLSNFIAGRPKTALLFWFFGEFRCGVLLFTVILVISNIK